MSNFKEHEIIGFLIIDNRKVTYLKPGVKRNHNYNDHLDDRNMEHLNMNLIWVKKWQEYYQKIVGLDDFEKIET